MRVGAWARARHAPPCAEQDRARADGSPGGVFGSPAMHRKGSFRVGVEEYIKQREEEVRKDIERSRTPLGGGAAGGGGGALAGPPGSSSRGGARSGGGGGGAARGGGAGVLETPAHSGGGRAEVRVCAALLLVMARWQC